MVMERVVLLMPVEYPAHLLHYVTAGSYIAQLMKWL